jgi:transcriptional regulator with XRE-family HTH domain
MPNLGPRIRELRQGRGLTLEQVAADTGLSVSFLSMLERDKVSISVDNLERLANYYEVHMVHFFNGPEASPVLVTRRAQIVASLGETGRGPAMVTLLANRPNARMEPLLVQIAPGQEEPHFRQHEADTLLYVLEGQARLIAESGEEQELQQGDLAYYVNYPHRRVANASAGAPLTLILITAPPTSSLDDLLQARQGAWVMQEPAKGEA